MQSLLPRATRRLLSRSVSSTTARSTAPPAASTSAAPSTPATSDETHYLVTLLRSPLQLPPSFRATANSLGLFRRLSSALVPISPAATGQILKLKALVGVRTVALSDPTIAKMTSQDWRDREGQGRQGSGLVMREGGSVIRVGSERARGDERGFSVVRKR